MAIHAALNEIDAAFKLENVSTPAGQPKSPEFLKINPRGAVPVLKIDDFVLREGAAILIYLLDSHENNLLPKSGLERAAALEWLSFANSTLHPAYSRLFFMMRNLGAEYKTNALYKPAIAQVQKYWDEIEERLSKQDFIAGNKLTIADILIAVVANWSKNFHGSIKFGEKTKNYFSKIISIPAYKKALEVEGVSYTANL